MEDDLRMASWTAKSTDSSYTSPLFLTVGVPSPDRTTGRMKLPFRLGSWQFELHVDKSHFPELLDQVENGPLGNIRAHSRSLIKRKVQDRLLAMIETLDKSLETYRLVSHIFFNRITGKLSEIGPRHTIGGDLGISVDLPDLTRFSWREIQVLTPVGQDRYKVTVQGDVFGCYTPRHVGIFSEEIRLWPKLSGSLKSHRIRCPKLRGLVVATHNKTAVRGILYDWIEPWCEANTLDDVDTFSISRHRREIWYRQISDSIYGVHRLGLRCVEKRLGWSSEVARRVVIDQKLNANLAIIAFGSWSRPKARDISMLLDNERWELDVSPEPDFTFLRKLRELLRLGSVVISPFDACAAQQGHLPLFTNLPADLRNMVYEYTLVEPGPLLCRYGGFYRRNPLISKRSTSSTPTEELMESSGLFGTSKMVRQESMSFFAQRNHFHVEAIEICSFLRYLGRFTKYLKKITIVVVLSEDYDFSQAQETSIMELRKRATNLRSVEVLIRNTITYSWHKERLIYALQGFRDLQTFEISPKSWGLSAKDRKEMEEHIQRK